jgi:hypothetical protein
VFVFFNDNRSYYGEILAVTDEIIKNIEHVKNNVDGGKEGFSPKAALYSRNPPCAATGSNSTKCEA